MVNIQRIFRHKGKRYLYKKFNIIGCPNWIVEEVREPSSFSGPHSNLYSHKNEVWGKVGSFVDEKYYAHLPILSDERSTAFQEELDYREDLEKKLIMKARGLLGV